MRRLLLAWLISVSLLLLVSEVGQIADGARTALILLPWIALSIWPGEVSSGRGRIGGLNSPGSILSVIAPSLHAALPLALAIQLDRDAGCAYALCIPTGAAGLVLIAVGSGLGRVAARMGRAALFYVFHLMPVALAILSGGDVEWAFDVMGFSPLGWMAQRIAEPEAPRLMWSLPFAGVALMWVLIRWERSTASGQSPASSRHAGSEA
ncbi:MAG: hypothetical protein ACI841_004832 [Planctomycetota bacterium]|jgi:hypothetical protein